MYDILHKLLADQTGGVAFKCFGLWHSCYIIFFVALAAVLCLNLKNKSTEKQKRIINTMIGIALGLYALDFFLMPFAYEEISISKLPFHVCTTMCVMCFWSRYSAFWGRFRLQFAMLGFLSNLTYLLYPAAMMWMNLHPLSYRVVQTLFFHGVMMVYGLLVLVYESQEFSWKRIYKDLGVVAGMTVWARLGNMLYTNSEKVYNWFYVDQDPFEMFPADIAVYIMPFINIAIFFAAELLVYLILAKAFAMRKNRRSVTV